MDQIGKLVELMKQQTILPKLSLAPSEIEAALDHRDDPGFSEAWMNAFRQVEERKGSKQDAEPRVALLREMAYLQAYKRWQSPDLAAYISDDFGLIGDALAIGYDNAWVNGLLHAYLHRSFPHHKVQERARRIGDDL